MATTTVSAARAHGLMQWGMVLFVLGLATGFGMPLYESPRMGLASHLEGVLNGILLVVLGLVWPRLALARPAEAAAFWLILYAAYANWLATLLAALWGAGTAMPLAGAGHQAAAGQEALVLALLLSLSAAIIVGSGLVIWGLRAARVARAGAATVPGVGTAA